MNNQKAKINIEIFFIGIVIIFLNQLRQGTFTEENLYGFILISLLLILILNLRENLKQMFGNEIKNLYKNLIIQKIVKINLLLIFTKRQFNFFYFFNMLFIANKKHLTKLVKIIFILITMVKKKKYFLYLRIFFLNILNSYLSFKLYKNLLGNLNSINLNIKYLSTQNSVLGYLINKQKIFKD